MGFFLHHQQLLPVNDFTLPLLEKDTESFSFFKMLDNANCSSAQLGKIDPYALFEALTGRKIDRDSLLSDSGDDYDNCEFENNNNEQCGSQHCRQENNCRQERHQQESNCREERRHQESNCREERCQHENYGHQQGSSCNERPSNERREEHPRPDHRPRQEVNVGATNPYALVEALLGHKIDRREVNVARIIADTLQTDYDELFDLKHNSVLYAGLKLGENNRHAQQLHENDIKILNERDLVTPDLSQMRTLRDLERIGLRNLEHTRVKTARMQNGKLQITLDAESVAWTVSNYAVTESVNELVTRNRRNRHQHNRDNEQNRQQDDEDRERDNNRERQNNGWYPPNSVWRNIDQVVYEQRPQKLIADINRLGLRALGSPSQDSINFEIDNRRLNRFDDPVQGATSNSWLIAAIFSVFWANPAVIRRASHSNIRNIPSALCGGQTSNSCANSCENNQENDRRRRLSIPFYDKGGRNNAHTRTVEVDYEVPVNRSSNDPIYARASGESDIWPALYEKAYAKWITGTHSDRPDITQTAYGDPIKAMAQINNREPHYYYTSAHSANDLVSVVRNSSVNQKTINPMAAFTHATGCVYRGANLVANHAYSVLGWTSFGERQYIIVRNPWGVTEPAGLTSYPGVIDRVESNFWQPAYLVDGQGVLAIEEHAFREYFAAIGVAK
jgi:hypothetical protein